MECVSDAEDLETKITGITMCAVLMDEVLDQALNTLVDDDALCVYFDSDDSTSSATKCKCGRDKWGHINPYNY